MKFKTCKECNQTKPEKAFRLYERFTKGYRSPRCKTCENKSTSARIKREKEIAEMKRQNQEWEFLYKRVMS